MPSLQSLLSDASRQIKNQVTSVKTDTKSAASSAIKSAQNDVRGIGPAIVRNAGAAVTGASRGAISAARGAISDAASQIMRGDISGALGSLTSGPGRVMESLSGSFGLLNGSSLLNGGNSGPAPGNSLAGALARSDPLLSFNWYCVLPDIAPLGGGPVTLPWYYVEEATPPFRNIGTRSLFFESRQKHFPDSYTIDALRLTMYSDSTAKSLAYWHAWQGAIIAPTTSATAPKKGGGYGRPKDFKKSIFIYLLDVNKSQVVKIEYVECWPTNLEALTLDSASSTRLLNHVQFSVGDVFMTLYNVPDTVGNALLKRTAAAMREFPIEQTIASIPLPTLPSWS